MASLVNGSSGVRIAFTCLDGKRRSLTIDRALTPWQRAAYKKHIEAMLASAKSGLALPNDTLVWLENVDHDVISKLEKFGVLKRKEDDQCGHVIEITPNPQCTADATSRVDRIALRPREAAESLGMSEKGLWNITYPRGSLHSVKVGSRTLYFIHHIKQWANEQLVRQEQKADEI